MPSSELEKAPGRAPAHPLHSTSRQQGTTQSWKLPGNLWPITPYGRTVSLGWSHSATTSRPQ